jgi:hypothetical protein
MRNVADRSCKKKTNFKFSIFFFFGNHAVYEIMWKNIVEREKQQMTIWHTPIALWVTMATNTHSVCVILNNILLQQWLQERASMLRYAHIACLVYM